MPLKLPSQELGTAVLCAVILPPLWIRSQHQTSAVWRGNPTLCRSSALSSTDLYDWLTLSEQIPEPGL